MYIQRVGDCADTMDTEKRHTIVSMRPIAALLTAVMVAMGVSASAQESDPPAAGERVIVVCPIEKMIEPGVQVLVERAVREANDLNAVALIFRINTPGGRVDSAIEIATAIGSAKCQTIAFVEGMGAISAGALISFSCDTIVMTSDSNIGAATPVYMTNEGTTPAGEKSESFMRAKMRALAEQNGYNPDITEAMVSKDIELRGYTDKDTGKYVIYKVAGSTADGADDGTVVPAKKSTPVEEIVDTIIKTIKEEASDDKADEYPAEPTSKPEHESGALIYPDGSELVLASGKLLTLTPSEAIKYGVADGIVEDLDGVVKHYLLEADRYEVIEPNWAEVTFRFLTGPTIAGLLLMLGMGGLYLEVRTPGFGLPGIIGITCLALFFGSHFILGMADAIDLILVFVGVALLIVEAFVLPGFGIAGVAGILCLLVGTYLSLVSFTLPQYDWDYAQLGNVGQSIFTFFVSFGLFLLATWKLLPLTPIYRHLIMDGTQLASEGFTVQDTQTTEAAIGLRGTASSMLRPAGKGRFQGKTYDIVTKGDFIPKGTPVIIVEAEGNRFVVDADTEGGDA
jgi:membrane-bound serine protease (ClpP class)